MLEGGCGIWLRLILGSTGCCPDAICPIITSICRFSSMFSSSRAENSALDLSADKSVWRRP
jgi:hypothetical protein